MHPVLRFFGISSVFVMTTIAWLILGGVMEYRTREQTEDLRGRVGDLWGQPQHQNAPQLTFLWTHEVEEVHTEVVGRDDHLPSIVDEGGEGSQSPAKMSREIRRRVERTDEIPQSPTSSDITVDLGLDQRLKGLMWYALFDVDFEGHWAYTHEDEREGMIRVSFEFPDAEGLYDGFRFVVNGEDRSRSLRPVGGRISLDIPIAHGDELSLEIAYRSRGMNEWRYIPSQGVANLENFSLVMSTDFEDIDYSTLSMSPSTRAREGSGWQLAWRFERIVTGHQIGMVMPVPIQPGELASKISFTAPISLFFFFVILFILGTLRGVDIHPINYLFLGASFFAFHLLFGYTVDHVNVVAAFLISSITAMILVLSYLRLFVSPRFAFIECGAAQLIYLIGFSLAHFWDGFTGLTVTVLSVLTLFLIMQLTGRIRWSEVLWKQRTRNPQTLTAEQSVIVSQQPPPPMG